VSIGVDSVDETRPVGTQPGSFGSVDTETVH
jgi:hypothetical protein